VNNRTSHFKRREDFSRRWAIATEGFSSETRSQVCHFR
jgi:hypothetical protein